MKVGLVMPTYPWFRGDDIWAMCDKAKQVGIPSLFFVDHIILTPKQSTDQGGGRTDVWTAMAYVAAVTNVMGWRPTLGQCAAVVPYRPPIQQAKIAATVDSLSGGRLMIGAGTGYMESEFKALGLDIAQRSDMADEYIKAMVELWTNPVASFHGKYVNFDEMTISVRPVQQPHPPILVVARGARPLQRIATFCQGWLDYAARDPNDIKVTESGWAEIQALWRANGRTGEPYLAIGPKRCHLVTRMRSTMAQEVQAGQEYPGHVASFAITRPSDLLQQIRTYADIGAKEFVVWLPSYPYRGADSLGTLLNQIDILGEHVLPKVSRD